MASANLLVESLPDSPQRRGIWRETLVLTSLFACAALALVLVGQRSVVAPMEMSPLTTLGSAPPQPTLDTSLLQRPAPSASTSAAASLPLTSSPSSSWVAISLSAAVTPAASISPALPSQSATSAASLSASAAASKTAAATSSPTAAVTSTCSRSPLPGAASATESAAKTVSPAPSLNPRNFQEEQQYVASLMDDGEPLRIAREAFTRHNTYPIAFALANAKWLPIPPPLAPDVIADLALNKPLEWALIIPGNKTTYVHGSNETSYYLAYQASWKAWTWEKSGVDCNRHVEIIANGAIPIFKNVARRVPAAVMFAYPKRLMAYVEDRMYEQRPDYLAIYRSAFLTWGHAHLTDVAMVRYMAEATGVLGEFESNPRSRLAFIDGNLPKKPDYQSLVVLYGAVEWLGNARVDVFYVPEYIYSDYTGNIAKYAHGMGVSNSLILPPLTDAEAAAKPSLDAMLARLAGAEYTAVVWGSFTRSSVHFVDVATTAYAGKKERLWVVNGEDRYDGWKDAPRDKATVFVRELA